MQSTPALVLVYAVRATNRNLTTLTPSEQALYDDLRDNRYGKTLRLEQEKIGFTCVKSVIAGL
jgi:hypothetical protein